MSDADNAVIEEFIEEDGKYFFLYKSGEKVEMPKAAWEASKDMYNK